MSQNTICSMFWNHLMIDGTGRVKPCCRFADKFSHSLNDSTLAEIFYNEYFDNLRDMAKNGQAITGCQRCYEEEENNKPSLRTRLNNHNVVGLDSIDIHNPKIQYLELSLSNDCNLMCRMCDSRYSYKLFNEEVKYNGKPFSKTEHTKANIDSIYPLLKDCKFIKFTGGEPLIIPDHWSIIDYIIKHDYAKNITLNYSTNCTVYPKKKITDAWNEFAKIELAVSLDSIDKTENEYQRHLSIQEDVVKNILAYKNLPTVKLIARPTVTIYNVYTLPETLTWLHNNSIAFNPTHCSYPAHISITTLPQKQKDIISKKYNDFIYITDNIKKNCDYIIKYMYSLDGSHLFETFLKHTSFLDKERNQNFFESYPYLELRHSV